MKRPALITFGVLTLGGSAFGQAQSLTFNDLGLGGGCSRGCARVSDSLSPACRAWQLSRVIWLPR